MVVNIECYYHQWKWFKYHAKKITNSKDKKLLIHQDSRILIIYTNFVSTDLQHSQVSSVITVLYCDTCGNIYFSLFFFFFWFSSSQWLSVGSIKSKRIHSLFFFAKCLFYRKKWKQKWVETIILKSGKMYFIFIPELYWKNNKFQG